jgi:hypothetical protein
VLSGPLAFNVLKVDLADPDIRVVAAKDRGQLFVGQKVHQQAARVSRPGNAVVAGVNADFWTMVPRPYIPIGPFVADGTVWYLPQPRPDRSVFALTRDGKPFIGMATMDVTLTSKWSGVLHVPRVNDARATGGLVLVTPQIGPRMGLDGDFTFVPLRMQKDEFLPNQPVQVTVSGKAMKQAAPPGAGSLLLAVGPDAKSETLPRLKPGASLTLLASVPAVDGVITQCVGGGPRLVRDGKVAVNDDSEKFGKSFIRDRHPRTAVGVSKDRRTLFLVTVDGRQPLVSIGQNLPDLAEYMVRIGCWEAMNLDGGGSTTMVVRGEVVNSPSDRTGPRTVTNSLLVVSTAAAGPLAQIRIEPDGEPLRLPAGTRAEMSAAGFDTNFSPVGVDGPPLKWNADAQVGTIRGAGTGAVLSTAPQGGQGRVTASSGSVTGEVPVEVLPVDEITAEPAELLLARGETCALSLTAASGGRKLLVQPSMIEFAKQDGILSASVGMAEGLRAGTGHLKVRIGTRETSVPYFVDRYRAVQLAAFDALPAGGAPEGRSFDRAKTGLKLLKDDKRQGSAGLAVTYAMTRGGQTRIILPVGAVVPDPPAKFGMWIRGDGKEAWVRGEIEDAAGRKFMLDFTEGAKGVWWRNQWRRVAAPLSSIRPDPANPGVEMRFPVTVKNLYLAQDQEAMKASGTIVLDGLEAVYAPPAN